MHDPLKPFPDTEWPPIWTPERLEWWAKTQGLGIQYYANGKPVYCPRRETQWEIK